MKSFVALFAVLAVVAADVSHLRSAEADAEIISQDADVAPNEFRYGYETSNGIVAQESGALKNVGREDEAIEVQGKNAYTAPDGSRIEITYIANENGYQPQGAHLPTPPAPQAIPDYIQRSIAYIAANAKLEPARRV